MSVARSVQETMRLPPLPTIKDILRLYRLRALRQLSQNFLLDQRLTDKIVKAAGNIRNSEVCEVGPGPGGITRSILNRGPSQLIVIEKDRRFKPVLDLLEESSNQCMKVILGDVMNFDMSKIFSENKRQEWEDCPPHIHIIGNLPFSVSTPLIIRWLQAMSERKNAWSYGRTRLTLTFQKEVGERMVADIMSAQRCRLSVMCQNWCTVEHKFIIPGRAFIPKPEVDVSVVRFTPLVQPQIPLPFKLVEKVVRNIFGFRQKYSIRGAETLFPVPVRKQLGKEMYSLADVNPLTRPFQLTIEEFGRLCQAYCSICDRDPRLYKYNHRAATEEREHFDNLYDEEQDLIEDVPH
ncbi:Dimethyladenosine transferase 1, mitochondrial [Cryptotermes secundus]|uniref:rRNA adenine N(6)-methyltransferase n=1 Tax=Cryptotermes secundus TaxID=105785 RepID=A0A2J7QBC4_9NEOP|nr:dimethyladenosine transferase 1, mitochondrial [Cryptotermes secundus]PNF25888.1 Dimethyladenosine transferase 1, mitochondrial [Cryptotermes secundus]